MATRKPVPKGLAKKLPAKAAAKRRMPQRSHVPPQLTKDLAKQARDDLPAGQMVNSRTMRFAIQMAEVRALVRDKKIKSGQWVPIAEFQSARGAAEVKAAMVRGERPVDGVLEDWDIEARRATDEDGRTARGSVLWVNLRAG